VKPHSRLTALVIGAWLCTSLSVGNAEPTHSTQASGSKPSKSTKKHTPRQVFNGWAVPESKLRVQPVKRPSGKIEIFSLNEPGAHISVNIYNADGTYNDEALDQLNHLWRCRRTETEKSIDPHIFEVLSHVYDRFKKPIALVSGFRNQRRTTSYHYVGSAADFTIVGLADGVLKNFVEALDTGGMGIGIYPHAGFIHVDVRPEPSYRWVDYSPPGSSEMGQPKTKRTRAPNT
jgi:uncharacterized protein YcbK (DUF882 family)